MTLSTIAFGVMAGFIILFAAAIFLMEWSSRRNDFPKSDSAEAREENPFKAKAAE